MRLLLHWVLSALAMLLVAQFVPGFVVTSFGAAMIAAAVYGLVNATLGLVLKILTFPLSLLTFGLFLLVINALMLQFSASFLPGIAVRGFGPAFLASLLLAILGMIMRGVMRESRREKNSLDGPSHPA